MVPLHQHESGNLAGCEVWDSRHIYCFDESAVIRLSAAAADVSAANCDMKLEAKASFASSSILDLAVTGGAVCVVTIECAQSIQLIKLILVTTID